MDRDVSDRMSRNRSADLREGSGVAVWHWTDASRMFDADTTTAL
jgi:hypothetical protein